MTTTSPILTRRAVLALASVVAAADLAIAQQERMRHRTLRERLGVGQPLLGLLQMYPNRSLEELAAASGYDFLMVDGEHGYFTDAELRATLGALANTDTLTLYRVPKLEPQLAERGLELGADMIVAPLVSTVEDAKAMARATTSRKGGLIVLLETKGGVENAAAILAVDGVDGVIIGPGDLSNDLGIKGQYSHPTFTQAFSRIERAAAAARKPYGTIAHGNNTLEALSARGHTILLQTSDHALIGAALKSQAAAARSALQGKAAQ
jgi:4-hydroxy-2-oxoheptanedioate aldolase